MPIQPAVSRLDYWRSYHSGRMEYLRPVILHLKVLIGNLPVPWFQLIDDWNSNGRRGPDKHYEEFPCDLFLMDLDGTWLEIR